MGAYSGSSGLQILMETHMIGLEITTHGHRDLGQKDRSNVLSQITLKFFVIICLLTIVLEM